MEKEIEKYLHDHIPISQAIGIHVEHASLKKVTLSAPFSTNINHKNTVFGGSLHSLATLACWSLLYINLKKSINEDIQIVITKSKTSYLSPVNNDFRADCENVNPEKWERFLKTLRRMGKARIELSATIYNNGGLSVDYHATFAVIKVRTLYRL